MTNTNQESVENISGISVTFFVQGTEVGFKFEYNQKAYGRAANITEGNPADKLNAMRRLATTIINRLRLSLSEEERIKVAQKICGLLGITDDITNALIMLEHVDFEAIKNEIWI